MSKNYNRLLSELRDAEKIVVCGLGNEVMMDDGAGLLATNSLIDLVEKGDKIKNLRVIVCGKSPENFIYPIIKEKPTHIVFIDAVDFGAKPGDVAIFNSEDIVDFFPSTHALSIKFISDLLFKKIPSLKKVIVLGIQPKYVDFGEKISEKVRESSIEASKLLYKVLSNVLKKREKHEKETIK
ncbi:MAG: hydrogenase 3 maturation endopeptidase HyCI [Candidatus Asgardarchaeia archaeon]